MNVTEIAQAMLIFAKYNPQCEVAAGHNEIFAGDVHPDKIQIGDLEDLETWGWYWNEKFECWGLFV